MTISVWRYSHLALALSSFLFLLLAAVTGIILAFEPVVEKIQPYGTATVQTLTLAETLPAIRKTYPGINELTVSAGQFVAITGTDNAGKKLNHYIDPKSGKLLGAVREKSEFFQWVTAFHRSLFIHETGRLIIGIMAFLLMLITVSGTILLIQRQRGIKRFFTRIVKDNFAQYYHVVLGRLSLIPIFIIALSGTWLSLDRFELVATKSASPDVDFDTIKSAPERKPTDFKIFKQTRLSDVESITFPFSEDVEDYYTLKLADREVTVNQVTGDILTENRYPTTTWITNLSLDLHTGRSSWIWALVLAVASANILFFIWSGFAIMLKRIGKRVKNTFSATDSRIVILVGSENGTTYRFAQAIYQQLIQQDERCFITQLNKYNVFPAAEHLVVITATYGLGDAPANANRFISLLERYPQAQKVKFSVIGLGSHAYPDFCKFAFDVQHELSRQPWAEPLIDLHTVNDRSPVEFSLWAEAWAQQAGIAINVSSEMLTAHPVELERFTVINKVLLPDGDPTFLIRLEPVAQLNFTSGDLLAIYPANDHRERLYSIGKLDNEVQLSVKLLTGGLGSTFLHQLNVGDTVAGKIVSNPHFHFPEKAPQVILISNGTGIAPFLGMIHQNERLVPCQLYCGFRESTSLAIYEAFLNDGLQTGKLNNLHVALSREGGRQYVSHLLQRDIAAVVQAITGGAKVMICGSLAMQKDVLNVLDAHCLDIAGKGVSFYQSHGQILTDCY